MTLVLIGKDLVLEWSRLKIEDNQIPGMYTNYWASLGTLIMLQNQTKCHHLRARECKCKCLQLMGHLFDSPVQVPCLPIALQQLSVATCTNWQPPGANSGEYA